MKQVDILATCPETGKRVAFEACVSTFDTEPEQSVTDLASGADAVVVTAANRDALGRLEVAFVKRFGDKVDPRITLAMPCHLAAAPSLRHIFECPSLVYDLGWDSASKSKEKGGAT